MLNLKNCIRKYYYSDKVEDDVNKITTMLLNNKRKESFDTEEEKVMMKKPTVLMSHSSESFTPNAESTSIINNSFKPEFNNDEHTHIIEELSLREIDFEEPFMINENKCDKTIVCSKNNELEKSGDISEYCTRLMNIRKTSPLQTNKSANVNVTNFNAEHISISQWSKGDVVLNGKPLEVFYMLKLLGTIEYAECMSYISPLIFSQQINTFYLVFLTIVNCSKILIRQYDFKNYIPILKYQFIYVFLNYKITITHFLINF